MQAINEYLVVKKEVIEEEKSSGGIITNVSSVFDFQDKFSKKNVCKAEVVYGNENIPFVKEGERIVLNSHKGSKATIDWDEYTVITSSQFIAKIDSEGRYIVPPDCILIRIKEVDTQSLYTKWIVRNDGTKVQLFIQPEPDKNSTQRSKIFVSTGTVEQVGSDVNGIETDDVVILDYTVDNDLDNVLYYDEEKNKLIVINATTILHKHDQWAYATRQSPRDVKVASKGDIETFSPILGLIRKDMLIARFPYVFINHLSNIVEMVSKSGIIFKQEQNLLEREVLAVSDESKKRYGIQEGQTILVQDMDIFSVSLSDKKIDCILDNDVMAAVK